MGVDVFFVISGFVITSTLRRERERSGSFSLRAFYIRRIKRLLPALALMLTVITLIGVLAAPATAEPRPANIEREVRPGPEPAGG